MYESCNLVLLVPVPLPVTHENKHFNTNYYYYFNYTDICKVINDMYVIIICEIIRKQCKLNYMLKSIPSILCGRLLVSRLKSDFNSSNIGGMWVVVAYWSKASNSQKQSIMIMLLIK